MDLTPYLDGLKRDLTATAAPGGPEVARAAEALLTAMEPAARLCLLEALSDAAAEITTRLDSASVEVRLHGREADLVVTEATPPDTEPAAPVPPPDVTGDVTRITLRLPEPMKEAAERAAATRGVSVNSWLVGAVAAALGVAGPPGAPPAPAAKLGRRFTGYVQA